MDGPHEQLLPLLTENCKSSLSRLACDRAGDHWTPTMAKRETYKGTLICECGARSAAVFDENENPVYGGGLDTRVVSVEPPFQRTIDGRVTCGECGAEVSKQG